MNPGDRVRVTGYTLPDDTTFPRAFTGRTGIVEEVTTPEKGFDIGDLPTPEHMAICVRFGPGYGYAATRDVFWPEELEVLRG